MQVFAALSMLGIGAVTFVIGARLLLVARRTRQLPELAFGVAFLAGSVGAALAQVGQRVLWKDAGAVATGMNAFCFALLLVGTCALFVVTRRLYRPDRGWARAVCLVAFALAAVIFGWRLSAGELATARIDTPAMMVYFAMRLAVFAWITLDTFLYYGRLRKRLALGLADPVVTQQIGFWGVAGLSMLGLTGTIVFATFGLGVHPVESVPSTGVLTVLAVVTSVAMWCAFFPPEGLRRRALARAA